METESSLPYLQEPTARLIQPISPHPISLISIAILSFHLRLGLHSGLFPSGFPTKILYSFFLLSKRPTWPAYLILLDFMILIIFNEECK
jgi:hypothetical protein